MPKHKAEKKGTGDLAGGKIARREKYRGEGGQPRVRFDLVDGSGYFLSVYTHPANPRFKGADQGDRMVIGWEKKK